MAGQRVPTLGGAVRALTWFLDDALAHGRIRVPDGDAVLCRSLAARAEALWTSDERREVWRMLGRYRPQLSAYGIVYEAIPPPLKGGLSAPAQHSEAWPQQRREPSRPNPRNDGIASDQAAAARSDTIEERPSVRDVLGPDGVIARQLEGYEYREAQVRMAELVERGIARRRHVLVEAGTGTGKSLGYLVPAILSGKRVVVSTANKALQEQIFRKDIPFLQAVLPTKFTAALLKGRANYLCLNRLVEQRERVAGRLFGAETAFRGPEAARLWPRLDRWARSTSSGDIEQAPFAMPAELRELVTVESEACLGRHCPQYSQCFAERQWYRALEAQVVVVNHALLLRDLPARRDEESPPDDDRPSLLVLDEAHHLEEAATQALGVQLNQPRWTRCARRLEALTVLHPAVARGGEQSEEFERAQHWKLKLDATGARILEMLEGFETRLLRLGSASERLGDERSAATAAVQALEAFGQDLEATSPTWLSEDQRASWVVLGTQVKAIGVDLTTIVTPSDENRLVRFATLGGPLGRRRVSLHAAPIDVSEALREHLFGGFATVVATSATLASADGFAYWRARVGVERADELIVTSPFDYAHNDLLNLPADGAGLDPGRFRARGESEYLDRLANEVERLLEASDGRAFCLFSSTRALEAIHARLAPRVRWPLLKQGDLPRPELLRRFVESGHAVLFGVKSFWEGVDVQGAALSLVVIDKLPFAPPDDPIWSARCASVNRARGDNWAWFEELAIPFASLQLKQGFGRLIRNATDRGVVALLDGRLTTKAYGARILSALPPATRTRDVEAVRAFFTRESAI